MQKNRKKKNGLEQQNAAYLLIAPSYIIYAVFILIPVIWTIVMSFTDYDLTSAHFVGIRNYIQLAKDPIFIKSIGNTLYFCFLAIVPGMILGLALALLLNQKMRGTGFFRTLFYLPNIFSMVAVSMAWLYLYDTTAGILNKFLRDMGRNPVPWISSASMAMISVAIMSVWNTMGYNMILFLSGLQGIPDYLYEAAGIDGAGSWKKFWHITLPMLRPTTFFVFVMACINSFQVFGQVLIVTNGGPMNATTTVAHQIYKNGFEYYKMGYASSQAVILMLIIFIITMINLRYGRGDDNDLG